MKTKQNILLYLVLVLVALCSCSKEPVKKADQVGVTDQLLSTNERPTNARSLAWYPSESKIKISDSDIYVNAPSDWSYVGYDTSGKILRMDSDVMTKISCTCNTSGACNPFKASGPGGTFSGCGGDCTNCTMLQSAFERSSESSVLSGGYFNRSLKPRLIKNGESIPAVFDALFEIKEFQNALLQLYKEAYKGRPFVKARYLENGAAEAPEGYSLVGASIMGRGLMVVLPMDYVKEKLGYSISLSATCSCSEGSCSLKDKSVLGVGAIWCSGSCTGTCTLNTEFVKAPEYSIVLTAFRY